MSNPPKVSRFGRALLPALAIALLQSFPAPAQPVTDKAVLLFRDACLATAPSFEKAMAAAKKYGVKPQMDLGASTVGMAPDGAFSLQVRGRKECAVTAESSPGPDVAEQFRSVVAQAAGVSAASLAGADPIKVTLRGQTYVLRHDRKGGEAYVIMAAAGL
ncbi:hypothetical protein LMIY3S_00961 [Labrys miyagiensis]